ncbi:PilZ domain-containing protein [Paenibacillus thalictri]|uniref:PilZ domain-containing protein n=1 Tax=Paenibacillus thalictri TaxID=2527873 RepID=A0A4Q9DT05_9BACL|nr:PilZ domain-containing protein [Paenibacillus thalictri]TBL78224.1 PilZ domain-containing protein [Paenibacillus thalictri]
MNRENQRSFFRLAFEHPLCAELKIIGLQDGLETKTGKIAIHDVSAGGMRFWSDIDFTNELNVLFEAKFIGLGKPYKLLGQILRIKEVKPRIYEYSSKFSLSEAEESALISLLNAMSIKLRKMKMLSSCSFCTNEELELFQLL